MKVKTSADLRGLLLNQLDDIRSKKIDQNIVKSTIATVKEVTSLSRLDLDTMRFLRSVKKGKPTVVKAVALR